MKMKIENRTAANPREIISEDGSTVDPEALQELDRQLAEGKNEDGYGDVKDLAKMLEDVTGRNGEKIALSKSEYSPENKDSEVPAEPLENLKEVFLGTKNSGPIETPDEKNKKIADVQAQIERLKKNARVPKPIPKKKKTVVNYKPIVVVGEETKKGSVWKKFRSFFSKRGGINKAGDERREDFDENN